MDWLAARTIKRAANIGLFSGFKCPGRFRPAATLSGSVVAVVVAAMCSLIPGEAADISPPFSFAETAALNVTCAQLVSGVTLEIRNDTAANQSLHLGLDRLRDSEGNLHEPSELCGGITVSGDPTVRAGGSALATLRARQASDKAATYATAIVAFADTGPVARRPINVMTAESAVVDAIPLAESRSVTKYEFDSIGDFLASGLAIVAPSLSPVVSSWLSPDWTASVPVKVASGQTVSLKPGDTVGVLVGEHGTTAVRYAGVLDQLSDSTSLLVLNFRPTAAGTYEGKLDLTPGDSDTGTVNLKLTAKHSWPLAAATLLVGLGLAVVVQRWTGFSQPRGSLLERVKQIAHRHDELRANLTGKLARFKISDLEHRQGRLRNRIERGCARTLIRIDQKIVDDLNAQIQDLEDKVETLDRIPTAAKALSEARSTLGTRPKPMPRLAPSDVNAPHYVDREVDGLLTGTAMSADDLIARLASITAVTSTMTAIHTQEQRLSHYWSEWLFLDNKLRNPKPPELDGLKWSMETAYHGLLMAETAADVDAEAQNLDKVRDGVDKLWPGIPDRRLRRAFHVRGTFPRFVRDRAMFVELEGPSQLVQEEALSIPESIRLRYGATRREEPRPPTIGLPLTGPVADQIIMGARVRQFAVIIVALFVALITGIVALYVDKPWGSGWDYANALAWGFLTGTASVLVIAAAVDGLAALGLVRRGLGTPSP